jgi:glycosyltransferase involved in cell wall biosynthesis
MAESMALGKPVIATGYSGNMDFMNTDNSFLVPFSWASVPRGADPYPVGARWAEPDIEAAANLMRKVVSDPDLAAAVAKRGRQDVETNHDPAARASIVMSRFAEIAAVRPAVPKRRRERRQLDEATRIAKGAVRRLRGSPPRSI